MEQRILILPIQLQQLATKSNVLILRISTFRNLEQLSLAKLQYIDEIILRIRQIEIAIERISENDGELKNFEKALLDIESIYWTAFKTIKCMQKLPSFSSSWGANLGIFKKRDIIAHLRPENKGEPVFSISFPKEGVVYRSDSNQLEEKDTVYGHINEFYSAALRKFPDRTEELKAKVRQAQSN